MITLAQRSRSRNRKSVLVNSSLIPAQLLLCGRNHLVRFESVLPLQFLERRRSPERAHADDVTGGADVSLPPKVEACSTATRAVTFGGSTLFRYSSDWWSKISQEGMDTTRERMPSASSVSWASTARMTSLPVAMMITSGGRQGRRRAHRRRARGGRRRILAAV